MVLSLYGGKTFLSSKQETGKEKSALGLGEAAAPQNPAGAQPAEGPQQRTAVQMEVPAWPFDFR